jgi:hypothetical protein
MCRMHELPRCGRRNRTGRLITSQPTKPRRCPPSPLNWRPVTNSPVRTAAVGRMPKLFRQVAHGLPRPQRRHPLPVSFPDRGRNMVRDHPGLLRRRDRQTRKRLFDTRRPLEHPVSRRLVNARRPPSVVSRNHPRRRAVQHSSGDNPLAKLRHTKVRYVDLLHRNPVPRLDKRVEQPEDESPSTSRHEALNVLEHDHTRPDPDSQASVDRNQRVPRITVIPRPSRREPLTRWATSDQIGGLVQAGLRQQVSGRQLPSIRSQHRDADEVRREGLHRWLPVIRRQPRLEPGPAKPQGEPTGPAEQIDTCQHPSTVANSADTLQADTRSGSGTVTEVRPEPSAHSARTPTAHSGMPPMSTVWLSTMPVIPPACGDPFGGLPQPFPATLSPHGDPGRVAGNGSGESAGPARGKPSGHPSPQPPGGAGVTACKRFPGGTGQAGLPSRKRLEPERAGAS